MSVKCWHDIYIKQSNDRADDNDRATAKGNF